MMKMRNKVLGIMFAVALAGGAGLLNVKNVSAVDAGAVIGGGASNNTGGGGTSSGESSWLNTYSWIFYRAVAETGDIYFRPDAPLYPTATESESRANLNVISGECSQHINEGGGFWHYGRDAEAKSGNNFGLLSFVNGSSYSQFTYSVLRNYTGHAFSYDYSSSLGRRTGNDWALGQTLYNNGTAVYVADHYDDQSGDKSEDSHDALENFKIAYTTKMGIKLEDYPYGDRFPDPSEFPVYYFCYWPGEGAAAYSAKSNVGANGQTATTGFVSSYTSPAEVSVSIKTGTEIPVIFSHNVYSNKKEEDIAWSVVRDSALNKNGTGYEITSRNLGVTGSKVNFNTEEENRIVGVPVGTSRGDYTDGQNSYATRDEYRIMFTKDGTYNFCETQYLNGSIITKVCAKIVVSPDPPPPPTSGECGSGGVLGTYATGITSVISKVNNSRLTSSTYGGWQDVTYAMPTDVIAWKNCYFPGAQEYSGRTIMEFSGNGSTWSDEGEENVCWDTKNGEKVMTQAYVDAFGHNWTNKFTVSTDSPFGMNDGKLTSKGGTLKVDKDLAVGNTNVVSVNNNYRVALQGVIGRTFTDLISTDGTPITTSYRNDGRGHHTWTISNDCDCCGCETPCTCPEDDDSGDCGCCQCASCTHEHTNLYNIGSATDGKRSDNSSVRIPYNFNNTTSLSLSDSLVYAGETVNVNNVKVKIGTRENHVVENTYATQVKNGQVRLVTWVTSEDKNNAAAQVVGPNNMSGTDNSGANMCDVAYIGDSSQCDVVRSYSGMLNDFGIIEGWEYTNTVTNSQMRNVTFSGTYNIFDAKAGDYLCMAVTVYPATSGPAGVAGDTNLNQNGNSSWYVSSPQCRVIAKKPSFQVWGGDVYSDGGITTNTSEKRNIFDVYSYLSQGVSNLTVFGSWGEEGVLANGEVSRFASGAATGKSNGGAGSGSKEGGGENYCNYRTTLSFANYGLNNLCSSGGEYTGSFGVTAVVQDRAAIANYWGIGVSVGSYNGSLSDMGVERVASGTGKDIQVVQSDGDAVIGYSGVPRNATRVVKSGGNIYVNDNIEYADGPYDSEANVPQVVLYAKNIYISCNVTRVDAMLIAEGTVDTCYAGGDIDSAARSNQLLVNGVVTANRLILGRTYGNTVGTGSGTPAEIFNYDTSALLWGAGMASAEESDTLTVTYQHEIAPRY